MHNSHGLGCHPATGLEQACLSFFTHGTVQDQKCGDVGVIETKTPVRRGHAGELAGSCATPYNARLQAAENWRVLFTQQPVFSLNLVDADVKPWWRT